MAIENPSPAQIARVSPALARDTRQRLEGEIWNRPALGPRDRSLVTLAAMIARGQGAALGQEADRALHNGLQPRELSETITHLAYYSGWINALAAIAPVEAVFEARGIGPADVTAGADTPLPLDEAAEVLRAQRVGEQFGAVAPALVGYTTDYLFKDLWLRPGLAPRDRSLVTVAALVASGQVAQVTYHLNRAMDSGLTQVQAAEVITHLAFYAGWPNAMSALAVAKDIFAQRSAS